MRNSLARAIGADEARLGSRPNASLNASSFCSALTATERRMLPVRFSPRQNGETSSMQVRRSLDCEQKTVQHYRANCALLLSGAHQSHGYEIVKRDGSSQS